ncbi:MAG: hypothetical protein HKO10_03490 [Acidimicrobiia bacterium]|nr:hypothetical protein [Acidimicrobiia bacterium]
MQSSRKPHENQVSPADDRFLIGLFAGAGAGLLAGGMWAVNLMLQPGEGHQVLAFSLLAVSVVGSLGMVLSRGLWSRRLTQIAMITLVGLPLVVQPGWWIFASSLAAVAFFVVSTPWGQEGLRKLPPAEPIPDQAVVLSLGLLGLPAVAAIGQLEGGGLGLTLWAIAVFSMAALYSRAQAVGLWSIRILLPTITIPLVIGSPILAAVVIAGATTALVALSWHPQALAAITEATPRRVTPLPIPPELIPEEFMNAAGYDSSGRPLKPSP